MELIKKLIDIVLHVDDHLKELVPQYGLWIYVILFLIIFCETGLVVTPFLPGDSLLFAIGALAGASVLSLPTILLSLTIAAILGDTVNYWIGHFIGPKVFKSNSRFFNRKHLEKTHEFYERYGGKTNPSRRPANSAAARRSAVVPGLRRWPSARSQKSKSATASK